MMKKIFLLTAFLLLLICSDSSALTVYKEHGGLFGYKHIDYTRTDNDAILNCCDPGFSRCRVPERPAPGSGEDEADVTFSWNLVDYADNQIEDNNILTGSYYFRVHVDGESCDRLYLVTWEYTDAQNGITQVTRLDDICI